MRRDDRDAEWIKWTLATIVSYGYLRIVYEMYRPFLE